MTIYLNNSLPTTCSYCKESYKKGEVEDTDKVAELACHHFFHKKCIASKFNGDEDNQRDLTCHSCNQISIPKRVFPNFNNLSSEITAHLSTLRQDPYYKLQPDFLNAITELESRLDSLEVLLRTILSHIDHLSQPNISQAEKDIHNEAIETAFRDWLTTNIPSDSQCLSGKMIGDFLARDRALRTVYKEAEYLSSIAPNSRCEMIPEEGVPVLDSSNNRVFKMRVSKDYMLRTVKDYQSKQKDFKTITYAAIALLAGAIALFSAKNRS